MPGEASFANGSISPAEAEASASLHAVLEAQRAAFALGPADCRRRRRNLRILADNIFDRREAIARALDEDFGGRAREETILLEIFPLLDQIRFARRHLRAWMRRRRVPSSWFLLPSRAYLIHQPLGVVGIMGVWNYPFLLTLGPLIDALAAGNHVVIKPSELAPRSAEELQSIVAAAFAPDHVACVTGGPDLAAAFAASPFDHLLFTGSAAIGRRVMRAAAANLTPVTLELGGKSPAIVHRSYSLARAAERIVAAKLLNAGQTCVAPDHVFVPAGSEETFERLAGEAVARLYPDTARNPDYTRILGSRNAQRLRVLLADAAAKGARIVPLAPEGGSGEGFVPPTLVFGMSAEMEIATQEIFGPVLPVIPYRTIDEAIDEVNRGPRPLALYYFDEDRARIDRVLARTLSGGVTVNDCVYHVIQHNLPFGGVGASGMGHYHGFAGFEAFSKRRGVMIQSRWSPTRWLAPPFGGKSWLIEILLRLARRG